MPHRILHGAIGAIGILVLAAVGCAEHEPAADQAATEPADATAAPETPAAPLAAEAVLQSHADHRVEGTVRFDQTGDEVTVTASLRGLPPGPHGFHIHEQGDCTPPEFETAGGHFNPDARDHGGPQSEQHHAGDLGNLTAGEDGAASFTIASRDISLGEGQRSVVGRAVVVHLQADQFDVQPDGAAGQRIACGVIRGTASAP